MPQAPQTAGGVCLRSGLRKQQPSMYVVACSQWGASDQRYDIRPWRLFVFCEGAGEAGAYVLARKTRWRG